HLYLHSFPTRRSSDLMLKVFAPIEAKFPEIVVSKAFTALKIPTSAQIPIPIITMVRMVRSNWLLMESSAMRTFSQNSENIFLVLFLVRLQTSDKVTEFL